MRKAKRHFPHYHAWLSLNETTPLPYQDIYLYCAYLIHPAKVEMLV